MARRQLTDGRPDPRRTPRASRLHHGGGVRHPGSGASGCQRFALRDVIVGS